MAQGIRTLHELEEVVAAFKQFDEWTVDVETKGEFRNDPRRNEVFWISLAGPGRCDVIPCGHPVGEELPWPDDDLHRINPANRHYQERLPNPATGRLKWTDVPQPFGAAPKQLWVSDVTAALRSLFWRRGTRVVGHNIKFDIESLAKYWGGVPPCKLGDTLVAAKLVNENYVGHDPYALGTCVARHFRFSYDKKIGRLGPERVAYSKAYRYSYLDGKFTWLLWEFLKNKLHKEDLYELFIEIEMKLLPAVIDMEQIGVRVDKKALAKLGHDFDLEMAKIEVAINERAGRDITLSKPRDVAWFVYECLGKRCIEFTRTGLPSTAKPTLEAFAKDKWVAKLLEHSQLRKLKSSFVNGLMPKIVNRRIHSSFNQVGTVSGRFSSRNPNLQQMPSRSERGRKIRDMFIASPGKALVIADLSQIELRVLAHFTQDPKLMEVYAKGISLHKQNAALAFGPNYTPEQYLYAKNAGFCVPMDTQALTRWGWKSYDEVTTEDDVLGYKDGRLQWTAVLGKVRFANQPLMKIATADFEAVTTPNHRWIGDHRRQIGHRGLRVLGPAELETAAIGSEDRIFLSAPLKAGAELPITADEAALIAWLWGDGSIRRGKFVGAPSQGVDGWRVKFRATLWQTKPEGIKSIQALLKRIGIGYKFRVHKEANKSYYWELDPQYMRELWKRAELDDLTPEQFVLCLSGKQVQAFAEAAWQAEGWKAQDGNKVLAQNEGPILDAFVLAIFLSGHYPRLSSNGIYNGNQNWNVRFGKPLVTGQRLTKSDAGRADVWCLRTELGSWVMRQGNRIMLTGNSAVYGAVAATMSRKYKIPLPIAEQILDSFYSTYQRVLPWKEDVWELARSRYRRHISPPYIETILGRKRRLPALLWLDHKLRSGAERQAISVTISGSAADLFKVVMIDCHRQLQKQGWDGHILLTVHDELVVEVPEKHAEEGLKLVTDCMTDPLNPFTGEPMFTVPVLAESKIAHRWSEK